MVSGPRCTDLAELRAADVVAFATEVCPSYSTGRAKLMLTGLRSFLGYAHVEGLVPVALAGVVPWAAGWTGMALPKGLSSREVQLLLASCDRRRCQGRRDYAILVLLVRLGLRSAEVAALTLDDLDWRAGEIVIRGKGDHVERLPLPADVGDAVAGYLRRGRPASSQRAVFLRVHAPIRGLKPGGVAQVVRDGCIRRRDRTGGATPVTPQRSDRDASGRGKLARGRPGSAASQRLDHGAPRQGRPPRSAGTGAALAQGGDVMTIDIAATANDYLAMRRALGYKLVERGRLLGQFVEFLEAQGAERVTIDLAVAWARQPADADPVWWNERLSVVRGFAREADGCEEPQEVPRAPRPRSTS